MKQLNLFIIAFVILPFLTSSPSQAQIYSTNYDIIDPVQGTNQIVDFVSGNPLYPLTLNSALLQTTSIYNNNIISAIVYSTENDEVFLYVENPGTGIYQMIDVCPPSGGPGSITPAQYPDVIIRDNMNNPGNEYIATVVYQELNTTGNWEIKLKDYLLDDINGALNINLLNDQSLGDGIYPKIDVFINPNTRINGEHFAADEFAVVYEVPYSHIEIFVFDENANSTYNNQINVVGHTPDVATSWHTGTGTGDEQILFISVDMANALQGPFQVYKDDITNATGPILYSFSPHIHPVMHNRIAAKAIIHNPADQVLFGVAGKHDYNSTVACDNMNMGGGEFLMGPDYYYANPPGTIKSIQTGTRTTAITAGIHTNVDPNYSNNIGSLQYNFAWGTYPSPFYGFDRSDYYVHAFEDILPGSSNIKINAITGLEHFYLLNTISLDFGTNVASPLGYTAVWHENSSVTIATCRNTGFELLAAWCNYPMGIDFKYAGNVYQDGMFRPDKPIGNNEVRAIPDIKLYPNPANSGITIQSGNVELDKTEVFDITGKVLKSNVSIEKTGGMVLDISDLTDGSYLLKIYLKDGRATTRPFTKAK